MIEENRIIKLARELGSEIQKEAAYHEYHLALERNDADDDLQDLIAALNLVQTNLQRAMDEPEKDTAKIEMYTNELNSTYNETMSNENMLSYVEKKNYMQELLNYIYQIVAESINGKDPYTIEQSSGCTGNCSTCGGQCG